MYQVIYSSVVIWCAILSYFIMGRMLTTVQWFAIFGTSVGLAVSAIGNTSPAADCKCGWRGDDNDVASVQLFNPEFLSLLSFDSHFFSALDSRHDCDFDWNLFLL